MTGQEHKRSNDGVSLRSFLGKTSATLVAAASILIIASAQHTNTATGSCRPIESLTTTLQRKQKRRNMVPFAESIRAGLRDRSRNRLFS
jgi:hypothetical protein